MKQPSPAFSLYPIATLRDLIQEAARRYQGRAALKTKKKGAYHTVVYEDLWAHSIHLSLGLRSLQLSPGDRIAILGENRSEWAIGYLGVVAGGFIIVPVDKDLKDREIEHILSFSGSRALITSGEFVPALRDLQKNLPALEFLVSMEAERGEADFALEDLLQTGARRNQKENVPGDDGTPGEDTPAAIIFTSGTTGSSKAVVLTHGNITSNVTATSFHVGLDQDDVLLSVLPLHHTYECTAGFLAALYQGATICYAESLRRIAENLVETQSSVMLGVPALFESIYARLQEGIRRNTGPRRFALARSLASISERVLGINFRRKIFSRLHRKLGGRLRLLISGGAALNPEVSRGFQELGIHCLQGYGLTEHAPIISVNRLDAFKNASVGFPLPGLDLKFIEGEITVRGPCVMQGYFRNPEATREVIQNGWLRTGDLGYLDEDGFLFISGRKKSVIVTPNGKNVYPEELEKLLDESPFILESLVWGGPEEDRERAVVQAIIVPDVEAFDREFGTAGYSEGKVDQVIAAEVRRVNQKLANYKKIKKFVLRGEEFEKTTTRKIKRYLYTGRSRALQAESGS